MHIARLTVDFFLAQNQSIDSPKPQLACQILD